MKTAVVISAVLAAFLPSAVAPVLPAPMVQSANNARPESGEIAVSIALVDPHYPSAVAVQANTLFSDVNAERAKHGLPALVRDATLDHFAYAKAVEMAARGYFGHTDPDGITFADRIRTWKFNVFAAENIAFDRDEHRAHTAFVNSPPHMANLMDTNPRRIGVAVVTVGPGETFYVEDFAG